MSRPLTAKQVAAAAKKVAAAAKKAAAAATQLAVAETDAYELGGTFKPKERDWLAPRIAAINSAIAGILGQCHATGVKYGIHVGSSRHGKGLLCDEGITPLRGGAGRIITLYMGKLEVRDRYKGRLDYAIAVPDLEILPGVRVRIILCGFDARETDYNAVIHNHGCLPRSVNTHFKLVMVEIYTDPVGRLRKRKYEAQYIRDFSVPAGSTDKVLFYYFAVVGVVIDRVPPGGELIVSYNQPIGLKHVREDHDQNYFMPRAIAERVRLKESNKHPGSDQILIPCTCEPGGCPGDRFFVFDRALLSQPAAASSAQQPGALPAPP